MASNTYGGERDRIGTEYINIGTPKHFATMRSIEIVRLLSVTIFIAQINHNLAEPESFLYDVMKRTAWWINTNNSNMVHRFLHTEKIGFSINKRCIDGHKLHLYFNISSILSKNETFKTAELKLYDAIESQVLLNKSVHILIYDILIPGDQVKQKEVINMLIDSKNVQLNQSSFNIQAAVARWIQNPEANHGLFFHILDYHNNTLDICEPDLQFEQQFGEKDRKRPELVIHTNQKVEPVTEENLSLSELFFEPLNLNNDPCRLHEAFINFTDIKWDNWILSPSGFYLNYCKGDCHHPMGDNMNTTLHAVMQTILNNVNPDFVPKVCCVPTSFEEQTVLYYDNNNEIISENFPNIKITGCGCI